MSDEPRNEEEFLDRESRLARESLFRLRREALESLGRTTDVSAWTERYPWQSLGTAAIAGIGAGWALGGAFRRTRAPEISGTQPPDDATENAATTDSPTPPTGQTPAAAGRLVTGLGTLTGAVASAAFTAMAEALTDVVKTTVHDALHPDAPATDQTTSTDKTAADATEQKVQK